MRKFILALALLAGVMFTIGHFAELQAILATLQRGDIRFIGLALILVLFWLLNLAASFRAVFRILGIDEELLALLSMVMAANFISIIAPSGGISGVAVIFGESRRRGYSTARAAVASVLAVLYEYASIIIVLTLGLIVLIRRNNLTPAEVIASLILVLIALVLAGLLILGMRSEAELGRVLVWTSSRINRLMRPLLKREYLSEKRALAFAKDAAEGLREVRRHPRELLLPLALALSSKAILISILFLLFLAFQVPFSPGTLIAGFSIGQLFTIVSPTPAGVGVVEGALTLGLNSLNVRLSDAAVITLAYRGITFWIPFGIGLFAFRSLGLSHVLDSGRSGEPVEGPLRAPISPAAQEEQAS